MSFPRHHVKSPTPDVEPDKLSQMLLRDDLISVLGLFEYAMTLFLEKHLINDRFSELGKEYISGLGTEQKVRLFNSLLRTMIEQRNAKKLSPIVDELIRKIKNAQVFRNTAAHGGEFIAISKSRFKYQRRGRWEERPMSELEEIFGNKALDCTDEMKYIFSQLE